MATGEIKISNLDVVTQAESTDKIIVETSSGTRIITKQNLQKEIESDIEDLEHSLSTTKTATGNPISISDSAHTNAEELTVELEPKQDLHGYDKPWAGGTGKNKLVYPYVNSSQTVSGVTFTMQDDGTVNINGTATATISFVLADKSALDSIGSGDYILNGCAQGGATDGSTYFLGFYAPGKSKYDFGSGTTISLSGSEDASANVYIRINSGYTASNLVFKPMLRLATETDTTFEPYSNICPISGYDETSVAIKDTAENPTVTDTYTLQFGDTVYGAEVDFVSGVATVTHGYIAEYAGETLPSTWISDRDVYASGTTPTTGAQVVYKLATPYTIQLTPQRIKMLKGNNVLTADGDMDLVYQTDSVVGDIKEWTEEEFLPKNSATAQHNYSTQEQVVGTWIDGSTLYEKTIDCGQLPAQAGTKNVAHNIDNLGQILRIDGISYSSTTFVSLPFSNADDRQYNIYIYATLTDIVLTVQKPRDAFANTYITLQYTKTTD